MSFSTNPQSSGDAELYEPAAQGRPADWRHQVAAHPELSIGLAFAAGLAVSTLLSSNSKTKDQSSSTAWTGLKAAALGLAARQTVRFAQRHFRLPRII